MYYLLFYVYTYVYNLPLPAFSKDYDYLSPMLCVLILYNSGGTFSLKSNLNNRLLFMEILFALIAFAERTIVSYFVLLEIDNGHLLNTGWCKYI